MNAKVFFTANTTVYYPRERLKVHWKLFRAEVAAKTIVKAARKLSKRVLAEISNFGVRGESGLVAVHHICRYRGQTNVYVGTGTKILCI